MNSASFVMEQLNVFMYHEDMDEVARGGVPHFKRQIVCRCYHCAVVAIPRYHGNLQLRHFVFQRRRVVLPGCKCKLKKKDDDDDDIDISIILKHLSSAVCQKVG